MFKKNYPSWKKKLVRPEDILKKIEPGMNIFIGTGAAEPRTLVNSLMKAKGYALQDLTLVQLVSFGDAISYKALQSKRYRLKTFFSGWVSAEAISAGRPLKLKMSLPASRRTSKPFPALTGCSDSRVDKSEALYPIPSRAGTDLERYPMTFLRTHR